MRDVGTWKHPVNPPVVRCTAGRLFIEEIRNVRIYARERVWGPRVLERLRYHLSFVLPRISQWSPEESSDRA